MLSLNENKIDLVALLPEEKVLQAPTGKFIATGGGFADVDGVKCNDDKIYLSDLKASH